MGGLLVLVGVVIGALAAWLIAKFKFASVSVISRKDLEEKYVLKELYAKLEDDILGSRLEAREKDSLVLNLTKELASNGQIISNLNEKLETNKKDIESLQDKFRQEFENLASRLLEEKSGKFLELNKTNMDAILSPLKEKIEDFKKKVEYTYTEEIRDITSLKSEIKHLAELNQQVSDDANKLANALKGESKTQGNWGEAQLEVILEKSGLIKNTHFRKQETLEDEEGQKRPDYIINLPENKHLIIDSKVSLAAYERYFNSDNFDERKQYLNEHLASITNHIKDLSSKNYQNLYQINPPDYVLMFIPIETAFTLIIKENPAIFDIALDRNVVLITISTLLACLRTVSYIWRQENQKKNVLEIARQSGALYDKFTDFINDLVTVGKKIEDAKESHNSAMNKLFDSKKKGDTLIGRVQNLKELGAKTTKALPQEMLDKIDAE